MKKSLLLYALLVFYFFGCEEGALNNQSSWDIIQKEIFAPNCANCHMSGSAITKQSGLDLSTSNAYENLVGVKPKNLSANDDDLLIVSSEGGMKGLSNSFLWEKINAYDREHFLADHPEYGQLMPPGKNFLTDGQLQFVRSWIEAGAPEEGIIADDNILLDSNRYELPNFKPLIVPDNGFQLHLGPFEVQPNYEKEFFVYTDLKINQDTYVNRIEIEMRTGSHHFLLYSFDDNTPDNLMPNHGQIRDLRDSNGKINLTTLRTMQYHKFFSGTQWPSLDYKLPPGVAFLLPKGQSLDQNSHYVNRSDSTVIGEVYTNFHTIAQSEVEHIAELFSLSNTQINLPPNKTTALEKTFQMNEKIFLGQVFSHAHQRMEEFMVEIVGGARNGEMIYWTNVWDHPPIINFDPPIQLNQGESLKLITTYHNPTNKAINFGFKSTDEMMILFGWYYK